LWRRVIGNRSLVQRIGKAIRGARVPLFVVGDRPSSPQIWRRQILGDRHQSARQLSDDAREPNARHADEKIRKALARGRGRHGQPFTFARTSLSL